jgi:predicted phosphodiesterase
MIINTRQLSLSLVAFAIVLFAEAARAQHPFSFVQLCDPQLCRYGCEHDAANFSLAVEYINNLVPDFVLLCGDLTDMSGKSDMLDRFLEIKNKLEVPCYCLVGNNDVGDVPSRELLESFRLRVGPDRFAFDHKGYRFIAVNTTLWESFALPDETAAQDAWFINELQTAHAEGKPIIVAGHHPANNKAALFHQYGVAAYLCGHLHINSTYEMHNVLFAVTPATCGNYDKSAPGFRLWEADAAQFSNLSETFLPLYEFYEGRDTDGDGLLDGNEDKNLNNIVDPKETDRSKFDTDEDGLGDGVEVEFGLDPLQQNAGTLPTFGFGATSAAIVIVAIIGRRSLRAPNTTKPSRSR